MERVCDSPNEAALALQSLPLLHLAGYSSPRHSLTLGHSPVALSVLLSEVFMKMCPPHETPSHLHPSGIDNNDNDVDKNESKLSAIDEDSDDENMMYDDMGFIYN